MTQARFLVMAMAMIVMAGLAPACRAGGDGGQDIEVGVNASESSLAGVWQAVAEEALFQEPTASLGGLMIAYRGAGLVYLLQYTFQALDAQGRPVTGTVSSDSSGRVVFRLDEGDGSLTGTHPRAMFEELDRVPPGRVMEGQAEAQVDLVSMEGVVRYDDTARCNDGPCRLYELRNGELIALKSVLLGAGQPAGILSVARFGDGAATPSSTHGYRGGSGCRPVPGQ